METRYQQQQFESETSLVQQQERSWKSDFQDFHASIQSSSMFRQNKSRRKTNVIWDLDKTQLVGCEDDCFELK